MNKPKHLILCLCLGLPLTVLTQNNTFPMTGNVGIGTTNPNSKVHVRLGSSGGSPHGYSDLTVEDDQNGMISILTPSDKHAYFGFADANDDYVGGMQYNHSNDMMTFRVNNHNSNVVINKDGYLGVGTTNPSKELDVNGQVQSKGLVLLDDTYGSNSDFTALYREDIANDNASVKFRIGDDSLGSFQIGYTYWRTGKWVSRFYVNNNGKVGIGTTTPDAKLAVNGDIHAKEVKVDLNVPGPDYVFKEGYDLKTIEEVQAHIKAKGHLPNIPSAAEMEADGIGLGEMNMKLLEKIEELTLYVIDLNKKHEVLKNENIELQKQMKKISSE